MATAPRLTAGVPDQTKSALGRSSNQQSRPRRTRKFLPNRPNPHADQRRAKRPPRPRNDPEPPGDSPAARATHGRPRGVPRPTSRGPERGQAGERRAQRRNTTEKRTRANRGEPPSRQLPNYCQFAARELTFLKRHHTDLEPKWPQIQVLCASQPSLPSMTSCP